MKDGSEIRWELEDGDPPRLFDRGLPEGVARAPLSVWMSHRRKISIEMTEHIISDILEVMEAAEVSGTTGVWMCDGELGRVAEIEVGGDTHGIGCLLYTLVTGRSPFPQVAADERAEAMATGAYARVEAVRPDAPANIRATIAACLDPDPKRRPATISALVALLAGPRDGVLPDAPPPLAPKPLLRPRPTPADPAPSLELDGDRAKREAAMEWMGKGAGAGHAPRVIPAAVPVMVVSPPASTDPILQVGPPRFSLGAALGLAVAAGTLLGLAMWLWSPASPPPDLPARVAATTRIERTTAASTDAAHPAVKPNPGKPAPPLADEASVTAMATRVLDAHEREVLQCGGTGTWKIAFAIEPDGTASGLRIHRAEAPDDAVQACIVTAVTAWRFDPILRSHPVTRTYTF